MDYNDEIAEFARLRGIPRYAFTLEAAFKLPCRFDSLNQAQWRRHFQKSMDAIAKAQSRGKQSAATIAALQLAFDCRRRRCGTGLDPEVCEDPDELDLMAFDSLIPMECEQDI